MLRLKHPFEYELNPTEMDKGKQWITLKLKNVGNKTLKRLDVEMHSLDTFYLSFILSFWNRTLHQRASARRRERGGFPSKRTRIS